MIVGACAWIDCRIEATHDGGDHEIVIGAVHHLEAAGDREPLLFHCGSFAYAVPAPCQ
jgi:3-hydroxy-9,10-secoandrosta-1,3,5(10)-triene-9,17-dione monooxygenase reductase component